MWLKPPEWTDHVCDLPKLKSFHVPDDYFDIYLNAIWRCDKCLKSYIVKRSEEATISGRHILTWRPYRIGD